MPKNMIACRPHSYMEYRDFAWAHMAEVGIKYVEMDVPNEDKWPERKEVLKKYGLTCISVTGGADLSKPDVAVNLKQQAKAAQHFGATLMFLSVKSGGRPLPECYEALRQFGDVAKGYGATICLETHPDLVTNGDLAVQTMKAVNHPNVKLNYDTANLFYYNKGIDGVAELKKFLPYMVSVHIKEHDGKPESWFFPGLGEGPGAIKFKEIFQVCNDAGFYGPFTIEIEGIKGEPALTKDQACGRITTSMKYLKSIGVI